MNGPSLDFGRSVRLLCGGLLVWAVLFLVTVVASAVVCARDLPYALWHGISMVPTLLLLAGAVALGAVYGIARRADQLHDGSARRSDDTRRVVAHVATTVCGLALIAIVWNVLPLVLTSIRC